MYPNKLLIITKLHNVSELLTRFYRLCVSKYYFTLAICQTCTARVHIAKHWLLSSMCNVRAESRAYRMGKLHSH